MRQHSIKYDFYLLTAAIIWGVSFVAQRIGAGYVGPFIFNGIRFALGSISLIPLIIYYDRKEIQTGEKYKASFKYSFYSGLLAGLLIFIAVTLQQISLEDTSAGKVAFITGLYILIVPFMGIFLKHKSGISTWIAALLAAAGLYLLCITDEFTISNSDLIVLVSTFFWAIHILLIDHFTKKADVLKLSAFQFATCAVLSLGVGFIFESFDINMIVKAGIPILYGGILSVGLAYTLQVAAQKYVQPSHSAIILSMESVFAALGGFLILNENLGLKGYVGCLLMFSGMLLSQLGGKLFKRASS